MKNDHYTFIQCNSSITPILKVSMFCSIFAMFSQEKRPLQMVKQKHQYGQLIPVIQGLIFTYWWGSINVVTAALC
jgi:hypothetical protein